MARTTEEQVKLIIEEDPSFTIPPFIDTANIMVDDLVASGLADDYPVAKLEMIERWLSAHFYAIAVPRAASEKAAVVAQSNQYKLDLNLAVTMYGQQVLAIDNSGYFASLNKKAKDGKRTKIQVLGSPLENCYDKTSEDC